MNWYSTVDEFLAMLRLERKSAENTVLAYRNDLSQFCRHLEATLDTEARWSSVTQEHISAYVAQIRGGYSSATVARKIAALKTLFAWMHKRGIATLNPATDMRAPRIERKAPRTLTQDETVRLIDAPTSVSPPRAARDRALLEFLYSTGMRVSEAIALKMSDLDLERGEARCVGRAGRPRVAPISPKAVAAIRAYLAGGRSEFLGNSPSDAVFLNPSGAALTRQAVWLMTRQHARAAGLDGDVTPHTLRHSRAAHMLDEGVDARRVQEWFGHANISTTQAYRINRAVAVIPAPPAAP